jgi:hypothetical protein
VAFAQKPKLVEAFGATTASYESGVVVRVEPDCVLAALHRELTVD